jgi:PST family polysaccharide transporter
VADVLRAVTPQVVGALFAAGVGFLLRFTYLADASELARIFLLAVVCGVVYLTVTVGIFRVTKPLELAASLTGRFRARRGQPL